MTLFYFSLARSVHKGLTPMNTTKKTKKSVSSVNGPQSWSGDPAANVSDQKKLVRDPDKMLVQS